MIRLLYKRFKLKAAFVWMQIKRCGNDSYFAKTLVKSGGLKTEEAKTDEPKQANHDKKILLSHCWNVKVMFGIYLRIKHTTMRVFMLF